MDKEENTTVNQEKTKFCKYCGEKIPEDAVICTKCGRQVEKLGKEEGTPQIVIQNSNNSANTNVNANVNAGMPGTRMCNKWVALVLAIILGYFGAHKFYEGKIGMGILYLFTGGLFFIGTIIDIIVILTKPTYYYVLR